MSTQRLDPGLIDLRIRALEDGVEAFIALAEQAVGPLPPDEKARWLANDPKAMIAVNTALRNGPVLEDVLPLMAMPCLVFAGEADPFYAGAKECVTHMPNANFVSFPGLDHLQAGLRSDLVLPYIARFLAEVSRA